MGSTENGGVQHQAPEGRKIGTHTPLWMFLTPSLKTKLKGGVDNLLMFGAIVIFLQVVDWVVEWAVGLIWKKVPRVR